MRQNLAGRASLPAGGMGNRATLGLCVASGGLLVLCFPPFSLAPLVWVALVPWLAAVHSGRRGAAILGPWLCGLVFFAGTLSWIALFGRSLVVLLAGLEALAILAAGVGIRATRPLGPWGRIVGAAAIWTTFEWLRSLTNFGLPWSWLAYAQVHSTGLLQLASVTGAAGLSFLIVLVNAALAEIAIARLRREDLSRPAARAAMVAGLGAVILAAGTVRAARLDRALAAAPKRLVAIVQPVAESRLTLEMLNQPWRPEEVEAQLRLLARLTRQASATSPDLIIWPESAIPGALNLQPDMQQAVADIARGSGAALVAGGPAEVGEQLRNSAYFISPDGRVVGRYDKVRPVPFGEYVPGRSWLPFLHYYRVRDVDIAAGERQQVFRLGGMTLGPMICFESTFGWVSLGLARHGAQTLVILTNDGWFGQTAAPRQHAEIAVFRAVETGLYTLRAASTGISEIISPTGQVEASVPLLRRGVLRGAVAPRPVAQRPSAVTTLYVRWGLWFSYLAAAMAAGSVAWGLTRRRLPR